MHNVISLSAHRSRRAEASGIDLTTRESILAVVERNGHAFIGGGNTLGKIVSMQLERAGLIRIEEYRRDGSSRVMLPSEFEPKSHEETSIWMVFARTDWRGLSA